MTQTQTKTKFYALLGVNIFKCEYFSGAISRSEYFSGVNIFQKAKNVAHWIIKPFSFKNHIYTRQVKIWFFSIFLSLFNKFLVQSFSEHLGHHVWPTYVKSRLLSRSQNFFLQKTISIPRQCRYGFFNFTVIF